MSGPDHPFLDELNAYLDGVLEPERVRALEERLSRDAELREELDELRRTVDLLHALAEEPAPAELRARILGALPRGRRFVLPSYVTAAAGLAAAVLVAILVWPEGGTAPVNEVALVEPVELDEAEERSVKTARDENLHTFSRLVETEASSTAKLGAVVKDARELDSVSGRRCWSISPG